MSTNQQPEIDGDSGEALGFILAEKKDVVERRCITWFELQIFILIFTLVTFGAIEILSSIPNAPSFVYTFSCGLLIIDICLAATILIWNFGRILKMIWPNLWPDF